MAFNPMQMMKLKERFGIFKKEHPKVLPFLKVLNEKAIEEGTVVTLKAETPFGETLESNIRLTAEDVRTIRMFAKK